MALAQPVNIGERERKVRLLIGISGAVIAVVVGALFVVNDVSAGLRWLVLIPLYLGIHTVVEARAGRCMGHAEKRQRNLDALLSLGGQRIEDDQEANAIRSKARKEAVLAVTLSVVLALLYVVATT